MAQHRSKTPHGREAPVIPIPLKFICSIHNMEIFKKKLLYTYRYRHYVYNMELIYKSCARFVRTFLSAFHIVHIHEKQPCRWSLSTTALRRRLPNLHLLAQLDMLFSVKSTVFDWAPAVEILVFKIQYSITWYIKWYMNSTKQNTPHVNHVSNREMFFLLSTSLERIQHYKTAQKVFQNKWKS